MSSRKAFADTKAPMGAIMLDCHIHTEYSPDSREKISAIAKCAESRGFRYICFADHLEIDMYLGGAAETMDGADTPRFSPGMFSGGVPENVPDVAFRTSYAPPPGAEWAFDFEGLFSDVGLAKKACPALKIGTGIEIGFAPGKSGHFSGVVEKYPFDAVINSVHSVDGGDSFFPSFFRGKEKKKIYARYFELVLESLSAPYWFSTVGHISYISRNAPYPDPRVYYADHKAVLDEILRTIARDGRILEVNSSSYKAGSDTLPAFDIVKRYYELGGRLLNFGSDAHEKERLGAKYSVFSDMAKAAGFSEIAIAVGRKITTVPI